MDVGVFTVSVDVSDKGAFDLFSDVAADGEAVDDEVVGDESVDDVAVDGGDWGLLSGTDPQPVKRSRPETARERTAGAGILVKRDRFLLLDMMVPPV